MSNNQRIFQSQVPDDSVLVTQEAKQVLPWGVESLDQFLFYCCPECDNKYEDPQNFINHAMQTHANATVEEENEIEDVNNENIEYAEDNEDVNNVRHVEDVEGVEDIEHVEDVEAFEGFEGVQHVEEEDVEGVECVNNYANPYEYAETSSLHANPYAYAEASSSQKAQIKIPVIHGENYLKQRPEKAPRAPGNIKSHQNYSKPKRDHTCTHCNKSFLYASKLKSHIIQSKKCGQYFNSLV